MRHHESKARAAARRLAMTRYALCIGINDYPDTDMNLAGCVNDANDWAAEFAARGFAVTTLLNAQAIKAEMQRAMRDLIGNARSGDLVTITFSGHGTYVYDISTTAVPGDESDGFDEALCPYDVVATNDPLIDDEIHAIFAARPAGVRLLLIADSCHSGTVSRVAAPDLSHRRAQKRFLPPSAWMSPSQQALSAQAPSRRNGAYARASAFALGVRSAMAAAEPADGDAITAPLDDVLLSGCMEGKVNYSYDAVLDDRPNGAFTFYALKTLRDLSPGSTYTDWFAKITPGFLPTTDYPQTPQIVAVDAAKHRLVLD